MPARAAAVAADPDRFAAGFRETTRLTPIALCVASVEAQPDMLRGLAKAAKLLRVAQLTVPASPIGTPFNTEVDRLRSYAAAVSPDGIRLSIKTRAGDLTEDPHTAVGTAAARALPPADPAVPVIVAATAHPAKFPDAVERATSIRPPLPARLADLYEREERFGVMPNDLSAIEAAVRGHARRNAA